MNKNLFKVLLFFILILFGFSNVYALSLEPEHNKTSKYKVVIEDDAELLDEDELARLMEEMIPLTEYGHIAFKTISDNYTYTSSYASEFYHERFGTESGTLLLIDMDNRMIYIFSDGNNHNVITNNKADIITDNVYTYASDERYYECASVAFEQMYTLLQGGKIAEPMRHISNIFIAITIGFFTTFIYVLISSGVKKASSREILKGCNVSFKVADAYGVKTGQTRVYSPQDSGGSSGGGGGGGGGGGSSGGGGGHSF